jgi:two-component system, OmpR family, sensor histidine kinase BaeS
MIAVVALVAMDTVALPVRVGLGAVVIGALAVLARRRDAEDPQRVIDVSSVERHREEISTAVHELRNPLATVKGFLETLAVRSDSLDEDTRQHILEVSLRNADVLSQRVDSLLEYERLNAGLIRLEPRPVDLDRAVPAIVEDCSGLLTGHTVVVDVPTGLRATVDPEALSHILGNLLGNAAKHGPTEGVIVVRARPERDEVALAVHDAGNGIEPDDLPHVFEAFYRGEQRLTRGAGIGLAVVRRLTVLSGGRVSVASSSQEGTTFTVRLPIAPPTSPRALAGRRVEGM